MNSNEDNKNIFDKKIEIILGINELEQEHIYDIKVLLVQLYEEKYGEIPVIDI